MLLRGSIIVVGIMLMMAVATTHCYSGDGSETNGTITIQGNVAAIDWIGSVLAINDAEFFIPPSVEIRKGTERVAFSDINVGDSVVITYSKEKDGSLKAIRKIISYSGEFSI